MGLILQSAVGILFGGSRHLFFPGIVSHSILEPRTPRLTSLQGLHGQPPAQGYAQQGRGIPFFPTPSLWPSFPDEGNSCLFSTSNICFLLESKAGSLGWHAQAELRLGEVLRVPALRSEVDISSLSMAVWQGEVRSVCGPVLGY